MSVPILPPTEHYRKLCSDEHSQFLTHGVWPNQANPSKDACALIWWKVSRTVLFSLSFKRLTSPQAPEAIILQIPCSNSACRNNTSRQYTFRWCRTRGAVDHVDASVEPELGMRRCCSRKRGVNCGVGESARRAWIVVAVHKQASIRLWSERDYPPGMRRCCSRKPRVNQGVGERALRPLTPGCCKGIPMYIYVPHSGKH